MGRPRGVEPRLRPDHRARTARTGAGAGVHADVHAAARGRERPGGALPRGKPTGRTGRRVRAAVVRCGRSDVRRARKPRRGAEPGRSRRRPDRGRLVRAFRTGANPARIRLGRSGPLLRTSDRGRPRRCDPRRPRGGGSGRIGDRREGDRLRLRARGTARDLLAVHAWADLPVDALAPVREWDYNWNQVRAESDALLDAAEDAACWWSAATAVASSAGRCSARSATRCSTRPRARSRWHTTAARRKPGVADVGGSCSSHIWPSTATSRCSRTTTTAERPRPRSSSSCALHRS